MKREVPCVAMGRCLASYVGNPELGAQHFPKRNLDHLGQPFQVVDGNIALAALNLTDIGAMKASLFRQQFLGYPQFLAGVPESDAKKYLGGLFFWRFVVFGLHEPKNAFMMTLGLQSLSSTQNYFDVAVSKIPIPLRMARAMPAAHLSL